MEYLYWHSFLLHVPLQQGNPLFREQASPAARHEGSGGVGIVGVGAGAGASIVTVAVSLPMYVYSVPQLMSSTLNTNVPYKSL